MTRLRQMIGLGMAAAGAVAAEMPPAWTAVTGAAPAFRLAARYADGELTVTPVEDPAREYNPIHRARLALLVDQLPANAPFHLPVAGDRVQVARVRETLAAVRQALPPDIARLLKEHRLLGPMMQWLIRRNLPGVTNETAYLSAAAHPTAFRAADIDPARLTAAARRLTVIDLPPAVVLESIYGHPLFPIRRATPGLDYSDILPEETFATPYAVGIVLRAPEAMRTFHFRAQALPAGAPQVEFVWVPVQGRGLGFIRNRRKMPIDPAKGEALLRIDARQVQPRLDVAVFARCGRGPYGPPAIISFYRLPQERRVYARDGRPDAFDWSGSAAVVADCPPLAALGLPRNWTDSFRIDGQGRILGFARRRTGTIFDEPFSCRNERILETHANDTPRRGRRVRYFAKPDPDDATRQMLDYEETGDEIVYPLVPFEPIDRGE